MGEFFEAIVDPAYPFLRYALLAGVLSSPAFGILGTYVVARRLTYLAAAISHSVLGGIGAALFLNQVVGLTWCDPMLGAVASALIAALVIGGASLYARQREDTVISAVWSVGMASGVLLLHYTRGYTDPMSYLFGAIDFVARGDLWLILGLDALVVGLAVCFRNKLAAVCFDEEFAALRGLRAKVYYLFLLCLVALTVVLLVRVVGIVMVIALLTLPAAAASQFSRRLWQMMALATLLCAVFVVVGLGISYRFELPSGPAIILLAAGFYLVSMLARRR
jgi:zinc transport system permease protein